MAGKLLPHRRGSLENRMELRFYAGRAKTRGWQGNSMDEDG